MTLVPNQDQFSRVVLTTEVRAKEYLEAYLKRQPINSEQDLARFDLVLARMKWTWSEVQAFVTAINHLLDEHHSFATPGRESPATNMIHPQQLFYLGKLGFLALSGAYGAYWDAEAGHPQTVVDDLSTWMACIAQNYRRVGLSDLALRVLDLMNAFDYGPEKGRVEDIRAVKL